MAEETSLNEVMGKPAAEENKPNKKAPVKKVIEGDNVREEKESGEKYKKVDITAFMGPRKPRKTLREAAEEQVMKKVDTGIERTKKDLMENVINPMKEELIAAQLQDQADQMVDGTTASEVKDPEDLESLIETRQKREQKEEKAKQLAESSSKEDDLAEFLAEDSEEGDEVMDIVEEKKEEIKTDKPDTFMEDPDEKIEEKKEEPTPVKKEEVVEKIQPEVKAEKILKEDLKEEKEEKKEEVSGSKDS